jgi:hypothetical protein
MFLSAPLGYLSGHWGSTMNRQPNKFPSVPKLLALSVAVSLLPITAAQAATYAPWLVQMGFTDSVASAANWGKNQLLGVVDTGIVANHPVFASGQVSQSLSSCAAVTFRCSNGVIDDNGHGTAVAVIAAGNRKALFSTTYGGYALKAGSVMGVASNANIVAKKVLNASGSGYSTDVANGIKKAADAGAGVINVSITYGNTADLVAAINYAAAKGAFIVWAGGNSAANLLSGASTTGLTSTAVNHLVFAGAVNSSSTLSSFSNKPGSGALVTTTGTRSNYTTRWIMAPGENIVAPMATYGNNTWGYWSGTSMAAPLVSGSLILLESAWPILKTNGTAANLLLATAKDLGAAGTDSVYGTGIVNLTSAFQPYGALSVTLASGRTQTVTSLTTSMITSGALGSLSTIQSRLANYTSFDGYVRNFSVNLSGLIRTPSTVYSVNPLPINTNTGPTAIRLADGGELAYWESGRVNPAERLGLFGQNEEVMMDRRMGFAMLTDRMGTTTALGYGYPVQYAYAKALYGNDEFARLSDSLNTSGLSSLAQGGGLFAYGTKLSDDTRVAMSWSGTLMPLSTASTAPSWAIANASNTSVGITHRITPALTAGVTVGFLSENHGLLGSTYDAGSALSFGNRNRSSSVGLSAAYAMDKNNSLLFEATWARTAGTTASGLFAGTSDLISTAYGMTYQSRNLWEKGDQITLSAKQPLRVTHGQAALISPSVDELGLAHYNTEWVSLVPTGRQMDYKLIYDRPLSKHQSLSWQATYRQDVFNIAGSDDRTIGAVWRLSF